MDDMDLWIIIEQGQDQGGQGSSIHTRMPKFQNWVFSGGRGYPPLRHGEKAYQLPQGNWTIKGV